MTSNNNLSPFLELVERAKHKDTDAFQDLYHLTYATQFHIALSFLQNTYLAEDAVQEAYLNAWKDLSNLREAEKFNSWLGSITRRMAIRIGQKVQKQNITNEPFFEETLMEEASDLSELIVKRELYEELHKSLDQLPVRQRRALEERYFLFHSNKEIAEHMACTEHDVKYYLRSGKKKLANYLQTYYKGDKRLSSWSLVPLMPSVAKELSKDIKNVTVAPPLKVLPVHMAAMIMTASTLALVAFGITHANTSDTPGQETVTSVAALDSSEANKDRTPPIISAYRFEDDVLTLILEDNDAGVDYSQIYALLPDGSRLEPDTIQEAEQQVSFHSDSYPLQIHCADRLGNTTMYECSPTQ